MSRAARAPKPARQIRPQQGLELWEPLEIPRCAACGSALESDGSCSTCVDARAGKKRVDYERDFAAQCRTARLPDFAQQYPFARLLDRRFTSDFAWPLHKLLVEIQGGIWMKGGSHSLPSNLERDIEKAQCAAVLGYRLVPVTPRQVKSGHALDLVRRLLELGPKP